LGYPTCQEQGRNEGEIGMGFEVKADSKEGYLLITISGEYSLPSTVEAINLILEFCAEHKPSKVLVDVSPIKGSIPSMDRFYFGEAFAARYFEEKKSGKVSHARFAFLGKYPIVDPNRFGETVAVNRGMTLKVSIDRDEALDWLLTEGK